jgi:hypothetical protein
MVHIKDVQLPKEEDVKYLNRRLTWYKRVFAEWKQLGIALTKMYWLLRCKSKLPKATNFSHIKQYSNQSGLTGYTSGIWLPLPT